MSQATIAELETCICAEAGCWCTRIYEDAQVVADLRGPWRLLLLDRHLSRCDTSDDRADKRCDVVAVYPQDSNDKLKLVELKSNLRKLPQAKAQLAKGGELIHDALPSGFAGLNVKAEVHVRFAPTTTRKTRDSVKIAGRLVPIRAFRGGKQV